MGIPDGSADFGTKNDGRSLSLDVAEYLDSPDVIAEYLSEAFQTGDEKIIAQALDNVARAKDNAAGN